MLIREGRECFMESTVGGKDAAIEPGAEHNNPLPDSV